MKKLFTPILLFILILFGCTKQYDNSRSFILMGTTVNIKIKDDFNALDIINEAIVSMKKVSDMCDLYNDNSEVSRINKNMKTTGLSLSGAMKVLLEISFSLNRLTEGAFDITIGPLEDLWGFYQHNKEIAPDHLKINATLKKCGMNNIETDGSNVFFKVPDMQLDLNALAKGYSVDQAAKSLMENNVSNAIINAGGDVFCIGDNNGRGWKVGIRDPRDKKGILGYIKISDKAIATSGGYENFIEIDRRKYPHIIDPRTGYPVDNKVISATVVADTCVVADGLATAFFVLKPEESLALAQKDPLIDCIIITKENEDISFYVSSSLKDNLKLAEKMR